MSDERVYLALILGASEFPDTPLKPNPAFRNSAEAIAEYLASQTSGPDTYRVENLFDSEANVIDQVRAIAAALQSNRDATDLLIYYVGHGGFLSRGREYFLALRTTADRMEDVTALRASSLAELVTGRFADRRVFVMLDCCFAGEAVQEFQSPYLGKVVESRILGQFPAHGTALLCASSRDEPAISPRDGRYTVFCECLLDVLRHGVEGAGRFLTLAAVAERLRALVGHRYGDGVSLPEIHSPRQQVGDIAKERLFPNPAYTALALPDYATAALSAPLPGARAGAVEDLGSFLSASDEAMRAQARRELERIARTDDSNIVRERARDVLRRAGQVVTVPETHRERTELDAADRPPEPAEPGPAAEVPAADEPEPAAEANADAAPVPAATAPAAAEPARDPTPASDTPPERSAKARTDATPVAPAALAVFVQPHRSRVPPDSEVTWTCRVSNTGGIPVRAIEATDAVGTRFHAPFDLEPRAERRFKLTRRYGDQGGRLTIAALGRADDESLVSAQGSGRVSVRRPADSPGPGTRPTPAPSRRSSPAPSAPRLTSSDPAVSFVPLTGTGAVWLTRSTAPGPSTGRSADRAGLDLSRFREALRQVKGTAELRDASVNRAIRLIGEGERHYRIATGRLAEPPDWRPKVVEWAAEVAASGTQEIVMVKFAPPSPGEIVAGIDRLSEHIAGSTGVRIPVGEFV